MRIGLLARADRTGLGIQTHAFWRNMDVAHTLVVDLSHCSGQPPDLSLYPGDPNVTVWRDTHYPNPYPAFDPVLEDFLHKVDVVFTAETPYNSWLFARARQLGVRTVCQPNYEFLEHLATAGLPEPDVFALPSLWHAEDIAAKLPGRTIIYLPVPVETDLLPFRHRTQLQTIAHHAGTPAMEDRNGTVLLMDAMRYVTTPVTCRIRTQKTLPIRDLSPRVTIDGARVQRYEQLYEGGEDLFVMPRKFGGLCLARGSLVTKHDGGRIPIETVRVGTLLQDLDGPTVVTATSGRAVDETITLDVRGPRITSSVDHLHLIADYPDGPLRETKAEVIVPGDWMLIVRPRPEGWKTIRVGPRPGTRQGLTLWWPEVELDEGWCRLIGLWLAEGSGGLNRRRGRSRPTAELKWSFGPHEEKLAREVVSLLEERGIPSTAFVLECPTATYGPSTTWTVRCRSLWLVSLFEKLGLGRGAGGKRAPDIEASLVPALVGGWLDGDGNLDGRCLTGYSRSRPMIADFWRLLAKVGVLASITHNGERLDIAERDNLALVSGWTTRLRADIRYVRPPRAPARWRHHQHGWMVRVRGVERRAETTAVHAIETSTGRYIAEDLLTHNCLPIQEAMAVGMPTLMSDVSPQNTFLPAELLVPAKSVKQVMTRAMIDVFEVDPVELAARIDWLYENPDVFSELSLAAGRWAQEHSWEALRPVYEAVLAGAP